MKKILFIGLLIPILFSACSTVQSIIKSNLPYTASITAPATQSVNTPFTATSLATSFDQILGNKNGAQLVKDVRVVSATLTAINPVSHNLGVLKSVKLFIGNGDNEILVATRNDIGANIGSQLVLDVDNSKFIDTYIKSNSVRIRIEYTLSKALDVDVSMRVAVGLNTTPLTNQ